MAPIQNGLPHRARASVGDAAHGGVGADLGEGKVLSVGQPGGVARGDVACDGGTTHSPPYRDVEAVGIKHTVLMHGLPVQGVVGGAVAGPWTPWRRLKKVYSNTCSNLKHTPAGLSHGAK
jgi:hypothetical protein